MESTAAKQAGQADRGALLQIYLCRQRTRDVRAWGSPGPVKEEPPDLRRRQGQIPNGI